VARHQVRGRGRDADHVRLARELDVQRRRTDLPRVVMRWTSGQRLVRQRRDEFGGGLREDDVDARDSMTELLIQEGYSVSAARDGACALTYLQTAARRPDLILLDLAMPHMDGFEFRKAQLSDDKYASIPVIVVSADLAANEQMASLQVAAFVPKPLKVGALLTLIPRLL
jgi:CheY-like chemotaxis protein